MLFPWATKEYLLWEMTFGQLCLYYRKGMQLKYGKPDDDPEKPKPLHKMSHAELKEWQTKYGDIDGQPR